MNEMNRPKDILRMLRPRQWTKNLFVLAPLFFAGYFTRFDLLVFALCGALVFCILSSAVYIFNDISDLEQDRRHPEKRRRPLADGRVSLGIAAALIPILTVLSFVLGRLLGGGFLLTLVMYLVVNVFYSLYLKRVPILDVFCISSGFILRVLAGGAITGVNVSQWLLVCTLTLSLFLAFGKRRQELATWDESTSITRESLNGYTLKFLDHAISITATLTIICYILYVADPVTASFFGSRFVLFTALFVLYGMFRYLNLVQTHDRGGDPTALLFADRSLQATCLGWGLVWLLIIYFK